MPRTRWLVLGGLSVLTVSVVLLDVTGVIFEPAPAPVPPPALQFVPPESVAAPLTPIDPEEPVALDPAADRAVARALGDRALGPAVHAVVTAADGSVLLSEQPDTPVTPASSLKLLTGMSVLEALGPETRLATQVVTGETDASIILVGGGDATLTVDPPGPGAAPTASLTALARQTQRALAASGTRSVRLGYDDSAFVGPAVSPEWEPTYVTTGVIAPVTALMADQGLVSEGSLARYPDPARAAAEDFAELLSAAGINVRGGVESTVADSKATTVAQVESPPISSLTQRMLRDSDNQLAEALSRVAATAAGYPASFDGGAEAMAEAAAAHDIEVNPDTVFDASGLSRQDRVTALGLVSTLQLAATQGQFRPLVDGLPIAGFDGTMIDRFLVRPQSAAAGIVRAKTGTLTGVSTESGAAVTCDGGLVLYSFVADEVLLDTEAARDALDRAAAALTECG